MMPRMAKRKPTKKPVTTRTAKPNRTGLPLHVWLKRRLRIALDILAERNRRTLTTEIAIMAEKTCAEAGLWPLPDAELEAWQARQQQEDD